MINRNAKISDSVAREIVNQVVKDNLPAGAVLESEAEMLSRYAVSRGSLREALRILEVLGFIQIKPGPGGGPILLDPSSRQFSAMASLFYQRISARYVELLEMRLVLEPEAAALAAERRNAEQVRKLKKYLRDTRDAKLEDDYSFRAVGQGFHDLIAEMAGNRILTLVIHSCYDLFAGKTTGFLYPTEERRCIADIHEKIAQAVIDANADEARKLMRDHMKDYVVQAGKRFRGLMSEMVQW